MLNVSVKGPSEKKSGNKEALYSERVAVLGVSGCRQNEKFQ